MNEKNESKMVGRDVLGAPGVEKLQARGEKLKACNDRSRARLTDVLSISEKVLIKTAHSEGYQPGQYGQDYRDLGKAIAEIRMICKHGLSGDFPDYEWMASMMTSEHFDPKRLEEEIASKASEKPVDYPTFYTPGWLCELAKKMEARERPIIPGCPSLMPTRIPGGIDGVESGEAESLPLQNKDVSSITSGKDSASPLQGYEKFMTLPNGCRLVRFHGSETIRLLSSRKGKSGNPNNVFEIFVAKSTKKAFVRRDDMPLFTIEGRSVGYNVVEIMAVSALKRYLKYRMDDKARHKRRRAAKRAAANKAKIKEQE